MPTAHDYFTSLSEALGEAKLPLALEHIALLHTFITSAQMQELEDAPNPAERKKLLDIWFEGYIADPIKNLAAIIAEVREWNVLSEMAEMAKRTNQQAVLVTTAKPLSQSLKQMLKAEIGKLSETEDIIFTEDKSLIGGIKIRVNNREIDYSIQNRLAKFFNS